MQGAHFMKKWFKVLLTPAEELTDEDLMMALGAIEQRKVILRLEVLRREGVELRLRLKTKEHGVALAD